jgi:hypothetical protein
MPRNGDPVTVTLDIPERTIELRCWTDEAQKESDGRYDWKLHIEVKGGGIQPRTSDLDFTAPQSGYKSVERIEMLRTQNRADWNDDFGGSYWLHYGGGIFGTVKVRMIAGGAHYSIVSGYVNPKPGSRNLAASPSKRK